MENEDVFAEIDQVINGSLPQAAHQTIKTGLVPLKKASNPVRFIESEEFLSGPELFPYQFIVIRDFFELLCPFCNNVKRIQVQNDVPKDEQILFEYDTCPECGYYKYNDPDQLNFFNELVGCGGMRGSKSSLVAFMAHWITHQALCTSNLQERLGLIKTQTIDAAFVAVSSEQAEETVWDHYLNLYRESKWYQNYKKALQIVESADGSHKRGSLIRDDASNYIYFGERNLRIKSLHSNSASLAGKTRLFAVIDELSRFDTGESKRSATEVHRVMKRSLATITAAINKLKRQNIYDIPDATMLNISSPIFTEDKTMRLLDEAETQKRMYSFHKATWEMNPNITEEDLAPEFERDPVGAERDYAARPPGAQNPFVRDPNIIEACVDKNKRQMFDLKEVYFDVTNEQSGIVFKYIKIIIEHMRWINTARYAIHCDAGESGDSFGVAIGHMEKDITFIDGAIEIRPMAKGKFNEDPRKVHFPSVTDLLLSLNNTLSLIGVTYDKWNSIDQIQRLIDAGVLAIQKNLTRGDHVRFLNGMKNNKIRFARREADNVDPTVVRNVPCTKALYELKRLHDNGIKVDHPAGGSNDIVQCYVGVHRLLNVPEEVIGKKEIQRQQMERRRHGRSSRKPGRIVRLGRFR